MVSVSGVQCFVYYADFSDNIRVDRYHG